MVQIAELEAERVQAQAAAQESVQAQETAMAALEASEELIASLNARVAEEQEKTAAAQAEKAQVGHGWSMALLGCHLTSPSINRGPGGIS